MCCGVLLMVFYVIFYFHASTSRANMDTTRKMDTENDKKRKKSYLIIGTAKQTL